MLSRFCLLTWAVDRPVDNVVITTKGLQDRNINIIDVKTVENKGKLILSGLRIAYWVNQMV